MRRLAQCKHWNIFPRLWLDDWQGSKVSSLTLSQTVSDVIPVPVSLNCFRACTFDTYHQTYLLFPLIYCCFCFGFLKNRNQLKFAINLLLIKWPIEFGVKEERLVESQRPIPTRDPFDQVRPDGQIIPCLVFPRMSRSFLTWCFILEGGGALGVTTSISLQCITMGPSTHNSKLRQLNKKYEIFEVFQRGGQ